MNVTLITTILFVVSAFVVVLGTVITFLDEKSAFLQWIKPTLFYRYFSRIALILVLLTILFTVLSYII